MEINFQWNIETLLLIARRQHGKSFIIKNILKTIPKDKILVLDSNHEYQGYNRIIPKAYNKQTLESFIRYARRFINIVLVIEDLDLYLSGATPEEVRTLMANCTHQNIGVIGTAHQPVGFSRKILSEANHLLVGRLFFREDATILPMNRREEVLTIPKYNFLYRDPEGNEDIFKI